MNLVLRGLRVPLAHFTLEIDAEITRPVTCLFGPSGSGKTTLLDVIAGLRRPAAGSIELAGRVLDGVPARDRHIGYVPQDGALFPHLSVRGNLLYGRRQRDEAPAFPWERVIEVLGIGHLVDRKITGLSGGEKQRVAFGRALLSSPRLLLLDEPIAALDDSLRESILGYLRQVRDELGVPMLYVSHREEEVRELCQEVLFLDRGQLVRREVLVP